ncbi:MAG: heavy-metal-associated domain-containing protein [Caldimonas sp.]
MTEFKVDSMSCGGCVSAVTRALKSADPEAQVDVDLATKRVTVASSKSRDELAAVLKEAGYAPA